MGTGTPAKTDRNKRIMQMKKDGLKFHEIARVFKITAQRVSEIYYRELKKEEEKTRDLTN